MVMRLGAGISGVFGALQNALRVKWLQSSKRLPAAPSLAAIRPPAITAA